ncbi:MAG: DUF5615 family PIN-like protein [Caldilineaceae bacterium]|nr:DUF5615 family PIN-like protein [Caldilineaceae bacterium]
MATPLRFYLDENVPIAVARQLQSRGIDVVTVRDLGLLGAADETHLANATRMRCVLCTYDIDYLQLVSGGVEHTGIVFAQQDTHYIGDWVNWLTLMHAVYSQEELHNHVEYLP